MPCLQVFLSHSIRSSGGRFGGKPHTESPFWGHRSGQWKWIPKTPRVSLLWEPPSLRSYRTTNWLRMRFQESSWVDQNVWIKRLAFRYEISDLFFLPPLPHFLHYVHTHPLYLSLSLHTVYFPHYYITFSRRLDDWFEVILCSFTMKLIDV